MIRSIRNISTALGFALGVYIVVVILQPIIFVDRFGLFTKIAGVDVAFKTTEEAKSILKDKVNEYQNAKVTIGESQYNVSELISGFDADKTVNDAFLDEQRDYFAFSKFTTRHYDLSLNFTSAKVTSILLDQYLKQAVEPVDANIVINGATKITPEVVGRRLMVAESRQNIQSGLARLQSKIDLVIRAQEPSLTAEMASEAIDGAGRAVSSPISVLGDGVSYVIPQKDLTSWLKITSTSPRTLLAVENFIPKQSDFYYLDPNKVFLYVDNLAKKIDKEAINAKLGTSSGKVIVEQKEQVGLNVDRKNAINQIQQAAIGDKVANLKINTIQPEIRSDNLAELGITELVSTGWSDFSGSPVNRTHNIQTGAAKFNGVLLNPDEDVSFNKILGPVEANTGYLPELVILADKTVPQYGGGLCQVSSTAFRAALNAGLPILERHAHAYPVGYYKPFGVDATIYLPTPDLRFKNDTGEYILVQTRIVGKKLYFDFYGTKKPVTVKFSGNENAAGSVDIIENVTPTLSEQGLRGNNSFTAVFYRHIYDATGKLTDNDKFTSKYDTPDKYPH